MRPAIQGLPRELQDKHCAISKSRICLLHSYEFLKNASILQKLARFASARCYEFAVWGTDGVDSVLYDDHTK